MPSFGRSTEAERRLTKSIATGEEADLRTGNRVIDSPSAGHSWGRSREVRAEVLSGLLTGPSGRLGASGRLLKLSGVRITGRLDLEATTLDRPVVLRDCWFEQPIMLAEASLSTLRLPGCHVPGLNAQQLHTAHNLELNEGFTADGEVSLLGAQIGGSLDLTGARLRNPDGKALQAKQITVKQSMHCRGQFVAHGQVNLTGAQVDGTLDFGDASLNGQEEAALNAEGLKVGRNLLCEGLTANGEVTLVGAQVGGLVTFSGANLRNPGGTALHGNRITVKQSMYFRGQFAAHGQVNLIGAQVDGTLDFRGASLNGQEEAALNAQGLKVGRNLICSRLTVHGYITLRGGHVGGPVTFNGAQLTSCMGPALIAEQLTVGQDAYFNRGFNARGQVRLNSARIQGQLSFGGADFSGSGRKALQLSGLVARALILRPHGRPEGRVDLTHTRVEVLADEAATWPSSLRLQGFVYDSLFEDPPIDVTTRLLWLRRNEHGYQPQPYEQLAAVYRRSGREHDARRVAIAKRRHRRETLTRPGRVWDRVLDWTVGYGYRTWQAGLWLLLLVAIGAAVFSMAHPQQMTEAKPATGAVPAFQPWTYALDVLVPIVNLHQEEFWIPQGAARWWAWFSILSGWILTTIVIAAVTGLFRRE
jgi:hypothetical protein